MADAETPKSERSPGVTPASPEVRELDDLYELMRREGLESVDLKDGNRRLRLARTPSGVPPSRERANDMTASPPRNTPPAAEVSALPSIPTPLAGVFYRASSPTNAPFVKENDVVEPGQTLCIIEAMKVMNEIKADKRWRIAKILAENSRPVTAGQVLFLVEPVS